MFLGIANFTGSHQITVRSVLFLLKKSLIFEFFDVFGDILASGDPLGGGWRVFLTTEDQVGAQNSNFSGRETDFGDPEVDFGASWRHLVGVLGRSAEPRKDFGGVSEAFWGAF